MHMLAYFFDPAWPALLAFLERQRADRVRRVEEIARRAPGTWRANRRFVRCSTIAVREPGRSVGRPQVADALVAAGHAASRDDAFDRLLGDDCPAFVPRLGASPGEVIALVRDAGGIVSLAHPGLLDEGPDHSAPRRARGCRRSRCATATTTPPTKRRYRRLADSLGLPSPAVPTFTADCGPPHARRLARSRCRPETSRGWRRAVRDGGAGRSRARDSVRRSRHPEATRACVRCASRR